MPAQSTLLLHVCRRTSAGSHLPSLWLPLNQSLLSECWFGSYNFYAMWMFQMVSSCILGGQEICCGGSFCCDDCKALQHSRWDPLSNPLLPPLPPFLLSLLPPLPCSPHTRCIAPPLLQVLPVVCVIGCVTMYWLAEWTLRRVDPTGGCLCHGLPSVSIADLLASLPPPLPPLLLHVACPPCVRVIALLCVLPCCPVIRVRRLHSQQASCYVIPTCAVQARSALRGRRLKAWWAG